MFLKVSVFLVACILSTVTYAVDFGLSSSGSDISIDIWFQNLKNSDQGIYSRIIIDSDKYQNGKVVGVCNDGSISGSSGSGTCSGHGGVNRYEEADFDRIALVFGPTYWVSEKIQLHGGLIVGLYTSEINIGDTSKHDFSELGIDFGLSYKFLSQSDAKVLISHETEQSKSYLGFWLPF